MGRGPEGEKVGRLEGENMELTKRHREPGQPVVYVNRNMLCQIE